MLASGMVPHEVVHGKALTGNITYLPSVFFPWNSSSSLGATYLYLVPKLCFSWAIAVSSFIDVGDCVSDS